MRLKIQFKNPPENEEQAFLLPISSDISTFYDLHEFILNKFHLKNKKLVFSLDEFIIFLQEQIKDIVLNPEKDIIFVEIVNSSKRSFQEVFKDSENFADNIQKKIKTCEFCKFIDKCAEIKNLFQATPNEEKLHEVHKKSNEIHEKKIFLPQKESKTQKETYQNIIPQSKKIINEQQKNFILPEKKATLPQKLIISQKNSKKVSSSETSSESSDSEIERNKKQGEMIQNIQEKPVVFKKAADNVLNLKIQSPEEEFATKKSQWKPTPNPKINSRQSQKNQLVEGKAQTSVGIIPQPKKIIEETKENYKQLSKEFLENYQKTHENRCFLQRNDKIKFKVYELCEMTFSPKLSLLYGIITNVLENNYIEIKKLNNEEILKEVYTNLYELSIDISQLNEERKKEISDYFPNDKNKSRQSHETQENTQNNKKINGPKKEYSKENFVASQVNYYFSDKNYYKDDFIQAHTKKNEDKYFPVRLLLNFPKIKNVTQDLNWLIEILKNFLQNEENCNYELENIPEDPKIRKKINP